MKKVVFICRGNLIRSQICKAIYNKLAKDGSYGESYGTDVKVDRNEGREIGSHKYLLGLVDAMKRHGLDISHEISKQLTEDRIKDSDKIIVMGIKEKIPKWIEKYNYEYWDDCLNGPERNKEFNLNIKNPKFGDAQDIEDAILLLGNKVKNLIEDISR